MGVDIERDRFLWFVFGLASCAPAPRTTSPVVNLPALSDTTQSPAGQSETSSLVTRCDALAVEEDCSDDVERKNVCKAVAEELLPDAAERAVRCMEQGPGCDVCQVRDCVRHALEGGSRKHVPECAAVSDRDRESGDEGVMAELCEQYASGMTQAGRRRFGKCLLENYGAGVRFCLWDPSSTPCSESGKLVPFDPY